jgi:hypothetical protein
MPRRRRTEKKVVLVHNNQQGRGVLILQPPVGAAALPGVGDDESLLPATGEQCRR